MTTTVLNLQRRLLAFGFNPGTPDGARARLREKGAPTHTPTGMATSPARRKAIRAHERNVLTAYSGPATGGEPWTIGGRHTSAAGHPKVVKGMTIAARARPISSACG